MDWPAASGQQRTCPGRPLSLVTKYRSPVCRVDKTQSRRRIHSGCRKGPSQAGLAKSFALASEVKLGVSSVIEASGTLRDEFVRAHNVICFVNILVLKVARFANRELIETGNGELLVTWSCIYP